jgi:hypothetical protein
MHMLGTPGEANMRSTQASIIGLLLVSACTSAPVPQITGGTIANSQTAFSNADRKCHVAGKFAVVRYIDYPDDRIRFDCIRDENRVPTVSVVLQPYPAALARR